jgi:hypothetical protein
MTPPRNLHQLLLVKHLFEDAYLHAEREAPAPHFDRELETVTPLAEEITRRALFVALDLFVYLDNTIENAKRADLELEKKYQSLEAEFIESSPSERSNINPKKT